MPKRLMASDNEQFFFTRISRTAWYLSWIPCMLDPVTNSEIKRQKFDISIQGYLPSSFLVLMETLIANDGHFDCHLYLPWISLFFEKEQIYSCEVYLLTIEQPRNMEMWCWSCSIGKKRSWFFHIKVAWRMLFFLIRESKIKLPDLVIWPPLAVLIKYQFEYQPLVFWGPGSSCPSSDPSASSSLSRLSLFWSSSSYMSFPSPLETAAPTK